MERSLLMFGGLDHTSAQVTVLCHSGDSLRCHLTFETGYGPLFTVNTGYSPLFTVKTDDGLLFTIRRGYGILFTIKIDYGPTPVPRSLGCCLYSAWSSARPPPVIEGSNVCVALSAVATPPYS